MKRAIIHRILCLLLVSGLTSAATVAPSVTESTTQAAKDKVNTTLSSTTTLSATASTTAPSTTSTAAPDAAANQGSMTNGAQQMNIELGPDVLEFIGEFEDALTDLDQRYLVYRSNASNNRTLHLKSNDDKIFEITLCVKAADPTKEVDVQLVDIVYSNDGPSDVIEVKAGNQTLGTATTEGISDYGLGWNRFKSTGPIGDYLTLPDGKHTMTMAVETDEYGVELDVAEFRAKNQDPEINLLCDARLVDATPVAQA